MSSVLKALKKLEEEKGGTAGSQGAGTDRRWASGGQPPRRPRVLLLVLAGLAVGLLAALALLWPRHNQTPARVAMPPAVPVPVAEPAVAAVPVTALPSVPPQTLNEPEPVQERRPARVASVGPAQARSNQQVAMPAPPRQAPAASPPLPVPAVASPSPRTVEATPPSVKQPASYVRTETPVRQVQVNRLDIPAPGQEWVAPPQLTVTEIFPPAAGGRMAIVNGLPVMVGTMVDEAMVEEIQDDRVIVSIGGKHVSVPLGAKR